LRAHARSITGGYDTYSVTPVTSCERAKSRP
jgi:hypothetical protein